MSDSRRVLKAAPITGTWRTIIACTLITLVGFNLRSVILGVPPILPLIQHDLQLSYATAGFLTALPVLALGGAAWASGLLAERIGARNCVSIGLALLGAGALLRALWLTPLTLFLFTLLLSLGIALSQTSVPVLARGWFPSRIGLVSALFSDGLIVGEAVAAGVTVPVMYWFLGRTAWIATFIFWAVPVFLLLAFWLWLAPASPATVGKLRRQEPSLYPLPEGSARVAAAPAIRVQRAPRHSTGRTRIGALHLGVLLGAGSLVYFGMNSWIASYNLAVHAGGLTPAALALLNTAQLPSSLSVTFFAQRWAGLRWPFVAAGITCVVAIVAWVLTPPGLELLWAALLGASSALVFTLGIALPPLLATPDEVARLTGITISLTYGVAFGGPFIGGELWDIFHHPAMAFLPVALAGVMLIVLGALLPPRSTFSQLHEAGDGDLISSLQ